MRRKIINIAVNSVIIIISFAFILAYMFGFIVLGVVEGPSMEPLFQTGDLVIIIKVNSKNNINIYNNGIDVNDVIVFIKSNGKGLIIHRVISMVNLGNRIYYVTKGDNNALPDYQEFEGPGVPSERVIGKVLEICGIPFKIPLIGYLPIIIRQFTAESLTF